jgi:hypothetical protein
VLKRYSGTPPVDGAPVDVSTMSPRPHYWHTLYPANEELGPASLLHSLRMKRNEPAAAATTRIASNVRGIAAVPRWQLLHSKPPFVRLAADIGMLCADALA